MHAILYVKPSLVKFEGTAPVATYLMPYGHTKAASDRAFPCAPISKSLERTQLSRRSASSARACAGSREIA